MFRLKSSFLIVLLSAISLTQAATEVLSPEVRRVGERLACKCGCGNTVASCQMLHCHYSDPAREKIISMVKAGKPDDEIVKSFVDQEGLSALATPPAEGFNLLAWVMPWVAVGIGLLAITWFIKRYHPKRAVESAPQVDEEMLARYRDRIDKDMAKLE
jgi:cytochrome c-type biogenesis protein CcmH